MSWRERKIPTLNMGANYAYHIIDVERDNMSNGWVLSIGEDNQRKPTLSNTWCVPSILNYQ